VSEIARIGLVVETAQAGIVGAAVDGLTVDGGFVSRNTRRDLAAVDRNGLRDTVLSLYL
jgi:hypothetical protein